jgi:S1-C subfamily serine protease
MIKKTGGALLLGFLLLALIFSTHVTLLGSGFLVGDGMHVITYHDLVDDAVALKVKFPNEDDIEAEVVFRDPINNLAILKLKEAPKVKILPLVTSGKGVGPKAESVFTLGYPWTNTMRDQHILLEGSAYFNSTLIELNMTLDTVNSGSPLFNANREVVGMVLLQNHAKGTFPVEGPGHFAIPVLSLEKALKAAKIENTARPMTNMSKEEFIFKYRNNIVLIEAI